MALGRANEEAMSHDSEASQHEHAPLKHGQLLTHIFGVFGSDLVMPCLAMGGKKHYPPFAVYQLLHILH